MPGIEHAWADPVRDCTLIVSNLERLACFDEAAGTPSRLSAVERAGHPVGLDTPSVALAFADEARRAPDDLTFHLRVQDEGSGRQKRLVISAPAIASVEPRPYLVISCVQNISRLQLLTGQPVGGNRVTLQLRTEHQATASLPWQVMENGQVLDAGRGLPAIEQIKMLRGASRIHVVSDHSSLDGLSFDAHGLDPLIDQARHACRW